MRWAGSVGNLTWMPEFGKWRVLSHDAGWLEIQPMEKAGATLAVLGTDGKLWVRTRDFTRNHEQQETLFP